MLENTLDSRRLQEIYSRTAAFYDDVVAEHQAAAKLIAIDMLNRQAGERLLELAPGTGWAFTRILQQSGVHNAYGLELAPGMLDVARARLGHDLQEMPALILGDARALPFGEACFDCLLCTYTLECMPLELILGSLKEMRRVLKHSGRLVLADLTDGEDADAAMTQEWKAGFKRDPEYFGGARPIQLRPLLEATGFLVQARTYSGHGSGWPSEVVVAALAA